MILCSFVSARTRMMVRSTKGMKMEKIIIIKATDGFYVKFVYIL